MTDTTTEPTTPHELVSVKHASDKLGTSQAVVRNLIAQRRVYAERIAGGHWQVDIDDVLAQRREYHPVEDPNNVADAPPLTSGQIHDLRRLLHGAPETRTAAEG
jgi:hypothetical protein